MNMKQVVIAALAALLVAACSQQSSPDAMTTTTQPTPVEQPMKNKPAAGALKEALPEGVQLAFSYHVRGDRIIEKEGQRPRRRVRMEYLEGDQQATFASIEQSLKAAGFSMRDRKDLDNGNTRAKFTKPRYGTVIVVVTRDMAGVKARNPAAVGRVSLDWPERVQKSSDAE